MAVSERDAKKPAKAGYEAIHTFAVPLQSG
jgi:hypothetical protein